jgi:lactoylglutathione lyase
LAVGLAVRIATNRELRKNQPGRRLVVGYYDPMLVHWSDGPREALMSDQQVRMIVLSTDDLEESIKFYTETLGFPLKFRDGAHFAALDGGSVTLALSTAIDHPMPGQVVVGIKTDDVDGAARAIEENGGGIVKGPYDDAHERRAVVYDNKGNGLVFYKSLPR